MEGQKGGKRYSTERQERLRKSAAEQSSTVNPSPASPAEASPASPDKPSGGVYQISDVIQQAEDEKEERVSDGGGFPPDSLMGGVLE